jgi:hypothetical protein
LAVLKYAVRHDSRVAAADSNKRREKHNETRSLVYFVDAGSISLDTSNAGSTGTNIVADQVKLRPNKSLNLTAEAEARQKVKHGGQAQTRNAQENENSSLD